MAKKNKNKASENVENIEVANESIEVQDTTIQFDFNDKDIVTLVGTGAKGFSMSEKKEYKVIGKVAKMLIKKGAAKLK